MTTDTDRELATTLISKLIQWVHAPDSIDGLRLVLSEFGDIVLAAAILTATDARVGRIALCELARRRKLFEFDIKLTTTNGVPDLSFRAGGAAVSGVKLKDPSKPKAPS